MGRDVVEVVVDNAETVEVITDETSLIEIIDAGPQGPMPDVPASIHYIFDGGGSVMTTGLKGSVIVPFDCTIDSWTLVASPSGSIVVDVWKCPLADYPPGAGDTITGGDAPEIADGQTASSASLTAWTTAVTEGDVLSFNIDSVSSVTLASIALKVTRA